MGARSNEDIGGVTFDIEINGIRRQGHVSTEALQDHCGLKNWTQKDEVEAYNDHRHIIQAIAIRKSKSQSEGILTVHTADF